MGGVCACILAGTELRCVVDAKRVPATQSTAAAYLKEMRASGVEGGWLRTFDKQRLRLEVNLGGCWPRWGDCPGLLRWGGGGSLGLGGCSAALK